MLLLDEVDHNCEWTRAKFIHNLAISIFAIRFIVIQLKKIFNEDKR